MRIIITCITLFSTLYVTYAQGKNQQIDSLNRVLKSETEVENIAKIFIEKAKLFEEINADSLEFYIEKALALSQKEKLAYQQAEALLLKAQQNIVKGAYDTSALTYEKANKILIKNDFPDLWITYYGDYGILNFYQGDFTSALGNFQKALELAKKQKDEKAQLRFLNNSALAMSYLNQAESSIKVHEEAMTLAKKLNDSASLGRSLNNLGLIYEDMNEYERALRFYENALQVKAHSGTAVDILNSKYNVAEMHREIAKKNNDTLLLQETKIEFQNIYKEAKKMQYGKVQLFAQSGVAQIETSLGNNSGAIAIYEELIRVADSLNDKQILRVSLLNLGVNQIMLKKYREANIALEQARIGVEESNNPADKAKLYENLALVKEALGEFKTALYYKKKETEIKAALTSEKLQDKISNFEVKYETKKKENEVLEQRAELAENNLVIKKKQTQVYYAIGFACILGLLGYLFYSQQKIRNRQLQKESELQTALARVETQNKLQEQRLGISRDLHDNIGSQLTFVISSIDNVGYALDDNKKLKNRLTEIASFAKSTIVDLRDTIWAMNKEHISFEDLKSRILNLIDTAKKSSDSISFEVDFDETIAHNFSALVGVNIFRVIQEAVNNAIKHAVSKDEHLTISITVKEILNQFEFVVSDNGKGFVKDEAVMGNGIQNMEKRMLDIGGVFQISSALESGVQIKLSLPKHNIDL